MGWLLLKDFFKGEGNVGNFWSEAREAKQCWLTVVLRVTFYVVFESFFSYPITNSIEFNIS